MKTREKLDNDIPVFFELVRAGLWERDVELREYGSIDFSQVLRLAQEQSVVGLVAAGLERVKDVKVPQMVALTIAGEVLQIERRNKVMNEFIARLVERLREEGIHALLVKGQGIAQCYEKPLWRACGDVDLLLSDSKYDKAKELLIPLATEVEQEYSHFKHQGMTIDGWMVELHGTLHSRLSGRVDRMIDEVQGDVFYGGKMRSTRFQVSCPNLQEIQGESKIHDAQVFLPAADEDVVFVFTHILHHFFFEGIGLRQICDWCRLLWAYRESLDVRLLGQRLRKAGLMSEWKAFAAFAVEYLGMPVEAMPLFDADADLNSNKKKADRICKFVLEVGNFGQNTRRNYQSQSYVIRKFKSFWGRLSDMLRHFKIFPLDSIRFFGGVLRSGMHAAVRGE